MKKIYPKIKKSITYTLISGLLISAAGCDKATDMVTNYGGDTAVSLSSDSDSSINSNESFSSTEKTLKDIFGDNLKWTDSVNIQNISLDIDCNTEIPTNEHLNVYNLSKPDQVPENEEEYASRFFDSDMRKLEKLEYVNELDYMALLYKYRQLANLNNDDYLSHQMLKFIDSDFTESYGWMESDEMTIHMYEGIFQGIKYGLILGYDHALGRKHIYFVPVNIKDYYPEYDINTLMVENTINTKGESVDTDNRCTMTEDDVKAFASKYLHETVGLNETDSQVNLDSDIYTGYIAEWNINYNQVGYNADGIAMMSFSDGDFFSTYKGAADTNTFKYGYILSEQSYPANKVIDENGDYPYHEALYDVLTGPKGNMQATIINDGYVVYLNNPYKLKYNNDGIHVTSLVNGGKIIDSLTGAIVNVGSVMVTSKGLYGIDIFITGETESITENVSLLDFEKIKEAAITYMNDNLDIKELDNPKSMQMANISLNYQEVNDPNDISKKSMVPAWCFDISPIDGYGISYRSYAELVINAIDGSYITTKYYDYSY